MGINSHYWYILPLHVGLRSQKTRAHGVKVSKDKVITYTHKQHMISLEKGYGMQPQYQSSITTVFSI